MLSFLSRSLLRLLGWKVLGEKGPNLRAVVVAAPHTSNWDFIYFLLAAWSLQVPVRWMGKQEMFPFPVRWLFKKMGGIPVNRAAPGGIVGQTVKAFNTGKPMVLVLTPEATRKKVDYWKSGFYRIAVDAEVPVVFGILDAGNKEVGIVPGFDPSGDKSADMDVVREFYADVKGLRPDNFGEVRLKSEPST